MNIDIIQETQKYIIVMNTFPIAFRGIIMGKEIKDVLQSYASRYSGIIVASQDGIFISMKIHKPIEHYFCLIIVPCSKSSIPEIIPDKKVYFKDILPSIKNIIKADAFYELDFEIRLDKYIKAGIYTGKEILDIFNQFNAQLVDFSVQASDESCTIDMSYCSKDNVFISQIFTLKQTNPSFSKG